ncbi:MULTISPECIES: polyprenyl synthetase family protein [unclassified Pseudomonas]|uniref:polyprenyl synthetase family protein n=1 Tax=unclassified Pseudomonas TaxID=196821 RepID=UPI0030DA9AE4
MITADALTERTDYKVAHAQWREAFEYQARAGGKKVRSAIAVALSAVYKLAPHQTHVLCEAIELLNTSTLIHDDVLDGDHIRRGLPSVWAKFGVEIALNSGMCGYLVGLQLLAQSFNAGVLQAALTSLEHLHVGQHLDLQFSNGDVLPTWEEYELIAQANTGCLFVFLLDACQCLTPIDEATYLELYVLLLELAVYYRYVNDYSDVNHTAHYKKKGFAPDLEGGPKSILMMLANDPLRKGKKTNAQKKKIIKAYGRAGVFDAALVLIDATYATIERRLETLTRLHPEHDLRPLMGVLSDIRFEHGPVDNYYQQCLAGGRPLQGTT